MRWDLFCRVIDNHGDLGVCWRLAADLAARGESVRLWIDDPSALVWMAPGAMEGRRGVQVHRWLDPWHSPDSGDGPATEMGDVVVEAFGCEPPVEVVAAMAASAAATGRAPCWINLEYLSAEPYVERSHALPSPLQAGPGAGLTRWFYYPGFTARTGGLIREPGLLAARDDAQARQVESRGRAGAPRPQVTLFCYEQAPLADWLEGLERTSPQPLDLWIAPGLPTRLAAATVGLVHLQPGQAVTRGAAMLHALPHVDQSAFDQRLWLADLNFVRGEDSLVRALWAARPFVWQPYRQDDGAHEGKLDAFLTRYLDDAPAVTARAIRKAHHRWNAPPAAQGGPAGECSWSLPDDDWRAFSSWRAQQWARDLPDLTAGLIRFAAGKQ